MCSLERQYGPVGTVWFNGYWKETFTVMSYQDSTITVRWHGDAKVCNPRPARVTTHRTPREPKDKRLDGPRTLVHERP